VARKLLLSLGGAKRNVAMTTTTDLEAFESTLRKTAEWVREAREELDSNDGHVGYLALRAVLHTLRDRLPINEAAHLGAQLPMLIRGLYYEGWTPAGKPLKLDREDFLDAIREHFTHPDRPHPAQVVGAVFKVLSRHVSAGEIDDVKHALPADLRELWP